MCVRSCIYMCVSLRLLSHLSLMFAQSWEFLTSIIRHLSLFSDTPIALSYPPFTTLSPRFRRCCYAARGLVEGTSLGITGGDNAILLLANCDARKTALLSYEYSAMVAGDVNLPRKLPSHFRDSVRCPLLLRTGSPRERHISRPR